MEAEGEEWGDGVAAPGIAPTAPTARGRHIKKRVRRNKALSVGFDEKDLSDFVSGFHKRKKKRRKIAQKQLQEKERLQRIEARRKRKLERELALYGRAVPGEESPDVASADEDARADLEQVGLGTIQTVSGTKLYENGDMTITVTTSELPREEEDLRPKYCIPKLSFEAGKGGGLLPKNKPLKRTANQRSRKKHKKSAPLQSKGGKKGRKR